MHLKNITFTLFYKHENCPACLLGFSSIGWDQLFARFLYYHLQDSPIHNNPLILRLVRAHRWHWWWAIRSPPTNNNPISLFIWFLAVPSPQIQWQEITSNANDNASHGQKKRTIPYFCHVLLRDCHLDIFIPVIQITIGISSLCSLRINRTACQQGMGNFIPSVPSACVMEITQIAIRLFFFFLLLEFLIIPFFHP